MNNEIKKAVALLRDGDLVAFPTETVYGLGADATNPEAVKKIFAAKGRPTSHPVIVHLSDISQLKEWAIDIPDLAFKLGEQFWPGPLTLILKRSNKVLDLITGGQDTVGIRIPAHPIAHELLRDFGGGVAAPSANKFGRISSTTAEHVRKNFGDEVSLVLDGGACEVGIESTIIDLSAGTPKLLRPGSIDPHLLSEILNTAIQPGDKHSPRASGTLASHYAPQTPVLLIGTNEFGAAVNRYLHAQQFIGVLSWSIEPLRHSHCKWIKASGNAAEYARNLYANLHILDQPNLDFILIESPPESREWLAVNDRLKRAATTNENSA
jgi:L-threonylcarbamoyladenylate synthase